MHTIITESTYSNIDLLAPDVLHAKFYQGAGTEASELTLTLRNQTQPLHIAGIAAGETWAALKQYVQVQVGENEVRQTRAQGAGSSQR
jgi:hypothetical protein